MTNSDQNDPGGATPVLDPKANWGWLQARVGSTQNATLHEWLDEQLAELEQQYAELVTAQSLKRALRSEFRQSR